MSSLLPIMMYYLHPTHTHPILLCLSNFLPFNSTCTITTTCQRGAMTFCHLPHPEISEVHFKLTKFVCDLQIYSTHSFCFYCWLCYRTSYFCTFVFFIELKCFICVFSSYKSFYFHFVMHIAHSALLL